MDFKRTHYIGHLDSSMIGKKVVVGGWIEDIRELGKLAFLTLRDVTGVAQIVLVGSDALEQPKGSNRQSLARLPGTVQQPHARGVRRAATPDTCTIFTLAL